ncbi:MAG: hypothetical protein WBD31_07575 [Rubripirellula sp.]
MDAKHAALKKKLDRILKEAAELGAEMQALEQGPGTPHYDQIESHSHAVGQQLSQLMQQTRVADVTAEHPPDVACPDCGKSCRVNTKARTVLSEDGPVQLIETIAHCTGCRRDFFPSA